MENQREQFDTNYETENYENSLILGNAKLAKE